MSLDADTIVDRRRMRRKLTFWRVVAVLIAIAAVHNPTAFGLPVPLPTGNMLELFIGTFIGAITSATFFPRNSFSSFADTLNPAESITTTPPALPR